MTRKLLILLALTLGAYMTGVAQDAANKSSLAIKSKPKNMWEVGLNVGHDIITGDVDWKSGFGVGLHARKALDYVFSVRLDATYEALKGEEQEDLRPEDGARYGFGSWKPVYETNVISGDITLLASLNQFKVFKKNKINPYLFAGAGIGQFDVTAIDGSTEVDADDDTFFDDPWTVSPYFTGGMGLGFRVGKKASIGIEHKVKAVMGRGDDLIDAVELRGSAESSSRDLINYTNLRISFAIGGGKDGAAAC